MVCVCIKLVQQLHTHTHTPPWTPMEAELITMSAIRNFWNKSSEEQSSWKHNTSHDSHMTRGIQDTLHHPLGPDSEREMVLIFHSHQSTINTVHSFLLLPVVEKTISCS